MRGRAGEFSFHACSLASKEKGEEEGREGEKKFLVQNIEAALLFKGEISSVSPRPVLS